MSNNGNKPGAYPSFSEITDHLGGKAVAYYDFSLNGGTVGEIELDLEVPAGAIVTTAYLDVLTDPTSAGSATVALGLTTATDVLAATAIASVTGVVVAKEPSAAFKVAAKQKLKMTIGTAALTAGKIAVCVCWIGSFDGVEPL